MHNICRGRKDGALKLRNSDCLTSQGWSGNIKKRVMNENDREDEVEREGVDEATLNEVSKSSGLIFENLEELSDERQRND